MFERFTDEARNAVVAAQREASALDHGWIGTEHLLLALLADGDGRAARVLRDFAVDAPWARGEVERTFGAGALARRRCRRGLMPRGALPFTARAKKALELSLREAIAMGDDHIGSEHLLLGLAREGDGVAGRMLRSRGIDRDAVRAALQRDGAR